MTPRMRTANDVIDEKSFVTAKLPWIIGGAGLLFYILTLNHWVSFSSLGNVAMVSGWLWQPELSHPLYWLVTSPIRLLPASLIPITLNLFAALCGAAVLALLARTVSLLPQDRTEDQRLREKSAFSTLSIRAAWLAPVLAAVVCGLQLTFWENASAASSEIFDLLLFAYVVRCFLEFRFHGADSWLLRACLVYGAAMTNNWAMIAFFPVFLVALIWAKGLGFFDLRFIGQAVLLGAIGLCFYLLLPSLAWISTHGTIGFGEALKHHFAAQKTILATLFRKPVLFTSDHPLWVLALPSLLPVLAISLRWPSYFGDTSPLGVALAKLVFHFLHAALLGVCLWVALDPTFSPRNYAGLPGLPLYYLGALSVGYFAGYFLLIFGGAQPRLGRAYAVQSYPPALNALVTYSVWILLFLMPATLLYRNLPQIRTTNGTMLRNYAELMARDVPASGSVVLSDDPFRLQLLQSIWTQKHERNPGFLLDTKSLPYPLYHRFLAKKYPGRWLTDEKRTVPYLDPELLGLVAGISRSNTVFYLHPSFGYYFENFYQEPHRLVYQLKPYPQDTLVKPELSNELVQENQAFWTGLNGSLLKKIKDGANPAARKSEPGILDRIFGPLLRRAHVSQLPNLEASMLGRYASRELNSLGVDLQRQRLYAEAAADFMGAKETLTNNVVADINLEFNRGLQEKTGAEDQRLEERLGKRNLQDAMNEYGPFDEPNFCYQLGLTFFQLNNFRQAAQEFNRVAQLVPVGKPEHLISKLLLARSALVLQPPLADEALKITSDIHSQASSLGFTQDNAADLLQIEAIAYFYKKETNSAVKAIDTALGSYPTNVYLLDAATKLYLQSGLTNSAVKLVDAAWKTYPHDSYLLDTAVQVHLYTGSTNSALKLIESALSAYPTNDVWLAAGTKAYLDAGCYSNALETADQQLQLRPDNISATFAKGVAYLRLNEYLNAAAAFTPIVQLGTNDFPDLYLRALVNRAYVLWKGQKLEEAQKDYELLHQLYPRAPLFSYGLGEIAYARKDAKAASRYYKAFVDQAPTNSVEWSNAFSRLKELRR